MADLLIASIDHLLIRFGESFALDFLELVTRTQERPMRPNFLSLLQTATVRQKWKFSQFTSTGHITSGLQNPFPRTYSEHRYTAADRREAYDCEQPGTAPQKAKLPTKQELSAASEAQLANLRRQFALKNHPDRVSGTNREAATEMMAKLNRLIDDELEGRNGK